MASTSAIPATKPIPRAAAPTKSVMNSRRRMPDPKLRRRHLTGLNEYFDRAETGIKTIAAVHSQCRFSNRPVGVKRFQAISHYLSDDPLLQCRCRSRARASLRNRHQGPSIMGFEDEAEQSVGRPCRQSDSRFKRHYELTSSIVPRGTSFHGLVELEFSPIVFDPARFSCCCRGLFPGPAELSAINPYAVHDHG